VVRFNDWTNSISSSLLYSANGLVIGHSPTIALGCSFALAQFWLPSI
jgi:hypothetical protein